MGFESGEGRETGRMSFEDMIRNRAIDYNQAKSMARNASGVEMGREGEAIIVNIQGQERKFDNSSAMLKYVHETGGVIYKDEEGGRKISMGEPLDEILARIDQEKAKEKS